MRSVSWPVETPVLAPGTLQKSTSRISLIMLALHVPLAAAMYLSRSVATAHALGVVLLGLLLLARRRYDMLFYLVAYIAGSEVLWRICSAQTNHEFAKYACTFFLLCIGLRNLDLRKNSWVVFYFILLLPSIFITLDELPLNLARKRLSFNLSGPLSLTIAVLVLSNLKISAIQLRQAFLSFIYPIFSISTCIAISLLRADDLNFNTQSNFETSAGFGPNQVSSILAMGGIVTYLFYMLFLNKRLFRSTFIHRQVAIWLAGLYLVQSAFTFSRGGVYMAVASILVAGTLLLRDREVRKKFLVNMTVLSTVGFFFVLPTLNRVTDGAFLARYLETDTTGRSEILSMELELWRKNFFLGIGPGMRVYHIDEDVASAAHTEYTRMIGEHGLLGLLALILLLWGLANRIRILKDPQTRAIAASLITCALLFWAVNGMRIYAPQLLASLAFATILWRPEAKPIDPWAILPTQNPSFPDENPDTDQPHGPPMPQAQEVPS